MWITMICRRHERLFDHSRRYPTQEVPDRSGLIIRPRRTSAAEGLLAYDRTGWLVIDVEISGGKPKRMRRLEDCRTIAAEYGAGERVRRHRFQLINGFVSTLCRRRREWPE